MSLVLTILSGARAGERIAVRRDRFRIGRGPGNDLIFPEFDHVSTRHGELRREAGLWFFQDLGSTNGSAVRRAEERGFLDVRKLHRPPVELGDGDELHLGDPAAPLRVSITMDAALHEELLSGPRKPDPEPDPLEVTVRASSEDDPDASDVTELPNLKADFGAGFHFAPAEEETTAAPPPEEPSSPFDPPSPSFDPPSSPFDVPEPGLESLPGSGSVPQPPPPSRPAPRSAPQFGNDDLRPSAKVPLVRPDGSLVPLDEAMRILEHLQISEALHRAQGDLMGAAAMLGIGPVDLQNRIDKLKRG
jgi:hypothetical protein